MGELIRFNLDEETLCWCLVGPSIIKWVMRKSWENQDGIIAHWLHCVTRVKMGSTYQLWWGNSIGVCCNHPQASTEWWDTSWENTKKPHRPLPTVLKTLWRWELLIRFNPDEETLLSWWSKVLNEWWDTSWVKPRCLIAHHTHCLKTVWKWEVLIRFTSDEETRLISCWLEPSRHQASDEYFLG
jgi:hypothetical protein